MIWTVVAQTLLGFWLSAYLRIIDEARVDLEDQMAQINEKLSHELAVFNQALWLQKRRWSYLLHGTVQATLTAAIAHGSMYRPVRIATMMATTLVVVQERSMFST